MSGNMIRTTLYPLPPPPPRIVHNLHTAEEYYQREGFIQEGVIIIQTSSQVSWTEL